MSHKKLKVSRGENWSLDDRKDLLEAIKIEIKTIEDKKCDRDPQNQDNMHISKSTCCNH